MQTGGIILCGGRSSRMGLPKLSLPFGDELMLPRVVRLLSEVVERVVIVAAPEQELPPLPSTSGWVNVPGSAAMPRPPRPDLPPPAICHLPSAIQIVRDRREGRGPLEALAAGLTAAVDAELDAVYVTSCDVPLLVPAFVRRMFELLGEHDIAVPRDGEFHHPLAAVYRPRILPRVERLLSADRLRPFYLFAESDTREVLPAEWHDVDPTSRTLMNLNRPADYLAALAEAGFTVPEEVLRQLG